MKTNSNSNKSHHQKFEKFLINYLVNFEFRKVSDQTIEKQYFFSKQFNKSISERKLLKKYFFEIQSSHIRE